ncbi:hypothetical protein KQI38_15485 [Tissierella carlieri]|jgi:hypothetical protein|uniref:Spore coat protein n=1 Tax=Tissierella carlieri TaxID=689904 RepID=A0ABT1SE80_9FIRM|nr:MULTISPECIES: hypothetical protein [Tissierella]MBU5313426.1 hypothetical protein [Tissierella carlieri]MCQ4924784.1 hypothetical protein [Tissierella carlieri]MDU5083472.1 hypothetical protein [Bacillota bacterium]OZV11081.1 hypothetical protein CIW83_17020 [Tissierella sp. P1]
MSDRKTLAPHETIQLRELMSNSILGYKNINASLPMVENPELKSFLTNALNSKKASIEEMHNFVNNIDME